ncbi:programmed cell death protein 2 isoform X4 [Hyperolius riggenbachi]|uniref:programmed cell death protein 2 isoform X4 n=1 Tax=Hyperolius riggenbachi TaxID=752182 RepID=UPI0035A2C5BC
MAASVKVMELGFIQKAEPWRLRSAQFPSKVGGRPALLGEVGVPLPEALQCGVCSQPLAFLLQVYAPCTGSFHRTLFIFCCRDPKCHQVSENRCFKEVQTVQVPDHGFLFPEYELVTEPEETDYLHEDSMGMETQTSDEISSCIESSMDDLNLNEEDLDVVAKQETKEDKVFIRFKKLISREPEQVLRYCRGGEPLWLSLQHIPVDEDIPYCPCGGKRMFEFQVMPQLLNHLKVDSFEQSIDWGILAVYTCSTNCNAEKCYKEEFLWKQDVPGVTM